MSGQYLRWQSQSVTKAMDNRRVLLLLGSRQCGKTTLAKSLISEVTAYRTLDDVSLLEAAKTDPEGFVKSGATTLIIDEIQRAPLLLTSIKKIVDEDNRAGQFLLTGSANIRSLPQVQESLAGRVKKIRLRPLTQGEIQGSSPLFFERISDLSNISSLPKCDKDELIERAINGGFPEPLKLTVREKRNWYLDYVESLLERDLKNIANIQHQDAMEKLIYILAAWSGKYMDITAIGTKLSIKRPTLVGYISALKTLYLVERVRPWTKTDYDRVGKQDKIFMTDCGLMSALLKWNLEKIRFDSDKNGKLIETFVFNELAAQIDLSEGEYELFHYRDREKREIDFLIEREDESLFGIEVKAGSAVSKSDFKHLIWFKNNLAKEKSFLGIVLYTGEHILSFGENLWAVPVSVLW